MANATKSRDLACSKCGYNLRGLPDDGVCPECGQRIAITIAQSTKTSRSKFYFTKLLCGLVVSAYALVVIWIHFVGGEASGFAALYVLYPFKPLLQVLGMTNVNDERLRIFFYTAAPLMYTAGAAVVGIAVDMLRLHFRLRCIQSS